MTSNKAFDPNECCGQFDPEPWESGDFNWEDRLFVKDRVRSVFHIPLNFAGVMKRNMKLIEAADACPEQMMVLSDENSLWGADVYLAVSNDVPGAEMVRLSGRYITRVFEGPYSQGSKWAKEMTAHVNQESLELKKLYFFYTTCPKCAKALGRNYVVMVANVAA